MEAVRPALQGSDAPAGRVDQLDRAIAHDVVHIALQQNVGVEGHVDLGQRGADVLLGVQVDAAESFLQSLSARFGEMYVAAVGVGGEILRPVLVRVRVGDQLAHQADNAQFGCLPVGGAGQDQRHERLVDQHRIGLVYERDIRIRRHQVCDIGDQLVAQDVEADLVDRRVGDIALISGPPLLAGRVGGDPADREAQRLDQRSHPLRVAAGKVVVDGDHMHIAAAERVAGCRDRAGQRLAFAGGHLHHITVEHPQRPQQLHVERTQAGGALRRFPGQGQELRNVGRLGQILKLEESGGLL